ncbi:Cystine/glutamate transporter [Varanus komodoensis]|nr:Cystine/glutamate transporter [Varanus komodoensis]
MEGFSAWEQKPMQEELLDLLRPANSAVVSLAFGRYILEPFFTPCPAPLPAVKLVALLGYYIVLILNSWSVSWSARLQTILSIIKLAALALIIVPGMMLLAQGHTENFQDAFSDRMLVLDKLPLAFYAGMFAYSGWFQTSFVREELVKPERNIPLAVIVSVITVIVGYMLTNVSYYTVLTAAEVLASQAVAVSFAHKAFRSLISVVPVLVSLSCFGTMNGGIFTFSRSVVCFLLCGVACDRDSGDLGSECLLSHGANWDIVCGFKGRSVASPLLYDPYPETYTPACCHVDGLATLGLIVHRCRHPEMRSPFQVPLFIPVSFTIICLFTVGMSFYSDPINISIGCAIVLSGFPVYYLLFNGSIPNCCRTTFYYLTLKLQILLKVVQQEIRTY